MSPAVSDNFRVETHAQSEMVEVTDRVAKFVRRADVRDGVCWVFVPHTTAGVTIQENADPDVKHDLLAKLDRLIPRREDYYRHAEGNSDSHLKTSFVGSSQVVFVRSGRLELGRWQGVYLCEFDGPRTRTVMLKAVDLGRSRAD